MLTICKKNLVGAPSRNGKQFSEFTSQWDVIFAYHLSYTCRHFDLLVKLKEGLETEFQQMVRKFPHSVLKRKRLVPLEVAQEFLTAFLGKITLPLTSEQVF